MHGVGANPMQRQRDHGDAGQDEHEHEELAQQFSKSIAGEFYVLRIMINKQHSYVNIIC